MRKILITLMTFLLALSLHAKPKTKSIDTLTLTADNVLVLKDEFDSKNVGALMKEAAFLDSKLKSGYPLILFLYTPGGSIQDGLELFEFLGGLNRPVHTVTVFAASMGFQAVQHLGTRYIVKYGTLMSHKARGGFSGEFGDGMSQLDSRYGVWLRRIAEMDRQTVIRTKGKQTIKSYRDAYSNELWLNGWEAVKQGYADKVVSLKCGDSLKGKTTSESFEFFGFHIEAKFDKCPINQNPLDVSVRIATNKGEMDLNSFINKSGRFGDKCQAKDIKADSTSSYYEEKAVEVKADLCASNTSLTLKQITEVKDKITKHLTRDLRFHVKYSY